MTRLASLVRQSELRVVPGVLAALILGFAISAPTRPERPIVRLNLTDSVPFGFYRRVGNAPTVGALVGVFPPPAALALWRSRDSTAATLPPPPLPTGTVILKPVVAAAGDEVCRDGDRVRIDGNVLPGVRIAVRTPDGVALPVWNECRRLGRGEVFLVSGRVPNSFDSRYLGAFGPAQIEGVYVPLWTW
jgi:conjugative transfer signal peptidase TraF